MDEHDLKKKIEIENAKARLYDTKHVIAETLNRLSKTEAEHHEGKSQYTKKLKSLQGIQGTQYLKVIKLDNDLKTLQGMLQSRADEEVGHMKMNEILKDELQRLQEETAAVKVEFCNKLEGLEESIKMGYMQLQNDKEAEVLLEVGLSSLKSEDQLPFIEKVLNKTLETKRKRETELKAELNALEESQRQARKEIQMKTDELNQMKGEYVNLVNMYQATKKLQESRTELG